MEGINSRNFEKNKKLIFIIKYSFVIFKISFPKILNDCINFKLSKKYILSAVHMSKV